MVKDRIPAGITAEHVLAAIQDFVAGVSHDFGPSTTYDLIVDDLRYPPKAILGLAAKRATGHLLKPRDFSGEEESRCFAILRALGFEVVPKIGKGAIWSREEYFASVDAYLGMLVEELAGRAYNKRAVRDALLPRLSGRTAASSEKRMQNISAALQAKGLKYITGYKPLANYADALVSVLDEALPRFPDLVGDTPGSTIQVAMGEEHDAGHTTAAEPPAPPIVSYDACLIAAPTDAPPPRQPKRRTKPAVPGALEVRERTERLIGLRGELWIVDMEVNNLQAAGRPDLAAQVVHASKVEGDGLGYDVRSFDIEGSQLHIEVKTTTRGAAEPFVVTDNEVAFSAEAGSSFRLYRVFDWGKVPGLYILTGSLEPQLNLRPREWAATPRVMAAGVPHDFSVLPSATPFVLPVGVYGGSGFLSITPAPEPRPE